MASDRTQTGIEGLDKALNGGIPSGNLVLLSGGAGTGKSTLCLQYCINGCVKFNEKALFISTEQTPTELLRQAAQYNWPLTDLINKGKLKIEYFDVTKGDEFLKRIDESIDHFKPNRIALDSLTTLADALLISDMSEETAFSMVQIAESVNPIPRTEQIITKTLLYRLIGALKKYHVTTLLTSELPEEGKTLSADGVSEFITDGVILLSYLSVGATELRVLKIRKMRYSVHTKEYLTYDFSSKGLECKLEEQLSI
ncbi:MAG: ATPase domain-containing protein [Candidatus Diapherotrites archaeon]|nr:ATPase domain-containing protein [Candidatus Diapherotrites archaeon]